MAEDKITGDRIAKVMARAGVASRRDAEKMIIEGRVTVNGKKVASPALDVLPTDTVTLDGKPIDAPQVARLWLYYKPLGLVTSAKDEKGRQTVFDTMPADMPRVMSVGRLDLNSEGLLLLTNDGELKRRLELPSTGWLRKYRVRVNGRPNDATFDPLRRGVTIEGEDFQPMEISLDIQKGANAWLTVGLREGKNREIRRAMTEVGLIVNRLIRVSYGPFRLNSMKPGDVVEVKQKVLRDQLGEGGSKGDDDGRSAEGDRKPRGPRSGGFKPRTGRDGDDSSRDRKPRSGAGFKPRTPRDGDAAGYDRKPRSGEGFKPRGGEGFRPRGPRDGEEAPRERKPRASKSFGSRSAASDAPRDRTEGDRPWKPRPMREDDGAKRGDKPFFAARPKREDGEAGRGPRGEKGFKPRTPREGDPAKPQRFGGPKGGPRGAGPGSDRPQGGKSFGGKPFSGKPGAGRSGGDDTRKGGDRTGGGPRRAGPPRKK